MNRTCLSLLICMVFCLVSGVPAEEPTAPTQFKSPYQAEVDYTPGQLLELNLMIDGIHWTRFQLDAGDSADFQAGHTSRVEAINSLENTGDHTQRFSLVVLLEDANGSMLERLTLKPVKLSKGKYNTDRQRFKIADDVLMELAKIYFFAETN